MARYILCPGWVKSENDGQLHYIGAAQLASLYQVPLRSCVVYPSDLARQVTWRVQHGDVYLHPRANGDYTLPMAAD